MEDKNFPVDSVNSFKMQNERIVRRSFVFWLVEATFLIALEQVVKQIIFAIFKSHLLYGSFGIQIYRNYNFAFSVYMPVPIMYMFYAAAIISICVYLYKYFFVLKQLHVFAWSLILAGALSNVGERLIFGFVRDYIYIFTGIFNLADFYIIAGVLILLLSSSKKSN